MCHNKACTLPCHTDPLPSHRRDQYLPVPSAAPLRTARLRLGSRCLTQAKRRSRGPQTLPQVTALLVHALIATTHIASTSVGPTPYNTSTQPSLHSPTSPPSSFSRCLPLLRPPAPPHPIGAVCCSVFSLIAVIFLCFVGTLLTVQPEFIEGIEDPAAGANTVFASGEKAGLWTDPYAGAPCQSLRRSMRAAPRLAILT